MKLMISSENRNEDECIGRNLRFIQSGNTALSMYEELWNSIKTRNSWKGEFLNKKKNLLLSQL